jgi:recombination associated protein RdgC
MWFKNLQLFRLVKPFAWSADALEEALAQAPFRRCGSLETATFGWVSPITRKGGPLVHAANGYLMIAARREEKLLPAAVVREVVDEKVAEIEDQQMRTVRRKERNAIRDEVLQDLLPKAFTRSGAIHAYLAPREGWLVVDNASRRKAEDLASLLRKCLGSLELVPPRVKQAPAAIMTQWLTQDTVPAGLVVEDECELRDPGDEGGLVRCKRQDLGADEVAAHLKAGKQAVKLALAWNDRLSFVLDEHLAVKRLRFLDLVQEQAADAGGDSGAERFDADFAIMSLELAGFLTHLLEAFGGEEDEAARKESLAA